MHCIPLHSIPYPALPCTMLQSIPFQSLFDKHYTTSYIILHYDITSPHLTSHHSTYSIPFRYITFHCITLRCIALRYMHCIKLHLIIIHSYLSWHWIIILHSDDIVRYKTPYYTLPYRKLHCIVQAHVHAHVHIDIVVYTYIYVCVCEFGTDSAKDSRALRSKRQQHAHANLGFHKTVKWGHIGTQPVLWVSYTGEKCCSLTPGYWTDQLGVLSLWLCFFLDSVQIILQHGQHEVWFHRLRPAVGDHSGSWDPFKTISSVLHWSPCLWEFLIHLTCMTPLNNWKHTTVTLAICLLHVLFGVCSCGNAIQMRCKRIKIPIAARNEVLDPDWRASWIMDLAHGLCCNTHNSVNPELY